jgi:hypothetical protein
MPARKLQQASQAVNQQAPAGKAANLVELSACVWAAVGKIAEKESRRDDIADGASHDLELLIAARIDGEHVYQRHFRAGLQVGHESRRASNQNPPLGQLIGAILCKLNQATREAVLRDLADEFAAAGGQFAEVDATTAAAVDGMLAKMRAAMPQATVRGSVSVKHQPAAVPLSIFG